MAFALGGNTKRGDRYGQREYAFGLPWQIDIRN